MKTLANHDYFYIMPQLICRGPSFLIEFQATPGVLASVVYGQLQVRVDRIALRSLVP
jgi:hypothetical protein